MAEQNNVMIITGHIGDAFIRAGGSIVRYLAAGHKVRILALTWGQYSESATQWTKDPKRTAEDIKAIRRQEGEEAAAILGVEVKCMGWDDGQLAMSQERIEAIRDEIGFFQPHVILTHPPTDFNHPDHVTTSNAVKVAYRYVGARRDGRYPILGRSVAIYYFEPTAPAPSYSEFHPNIYVDITDTFEQKMKAVAVINRTQPNVTEYYTAMAVMRGKEAAMWARGRRGQVKYAEAFVQDTPFTTSELPW